MAQQTTKGTSSIVPIVLTHERPVTHVIYNYDGDMVFTADKQRTATMWRANNGERVGTYDAHKGAVNSVAVNRTTTRVLTGASDTSAILWNAETGESLFRFNHETAVNCVDFAEGDQRFLNVTQKQMGREATIKLYKLEEDMRDQLDVAITTIAGEALSEGITCAKWTDFNSRIIGSDTRGFLHIWDAETGKQIRRIEAHTKLIYDFSFDHDRLQMITASDDCSAKLYDLKSMEEIQTYTTNIPVRSASISPITDHVILAGGQDPKDVTTTRVDNSQFAIRFFHKIFSDMIGTIKGGFSPVNSIEFSPDGKSFITGAEEGHCNIYRLPKDYFDKFSKEADIENIQLPPNPLETTA